MTDKEILSWIDTVIADYMYPDVEEELIEVRSKVHDLFESYEMLAKRDWIPVSERLPKDGQKVLVTTQSGNIIDVDTSIFHHASAFWKHYVIAWMPLPQPYKAESKIEQTLAYADQDTMMPAT